MCCSLRARVLREPETETKKAVRRGLLEGHREATGRGRRPRKELQAGGLAASSLRKAAWDPTSTSGGRGRGPMMDGRA